jgi:hypothetical protein
LPHLMQINLPIFDLRLRAQVVGRIRGGQESPFIYDPRCSNIEPDHNNPCEFHCAGTPGVQLLVGDVIKPESHYEPKRQGPKHKQQNCAANEPAAPSRPNLCTNISPDPLWGDLRAIARTLHHSCTDSAVIIANRDGRMDRY